MRLGKHLVLTVFIDVTTFYLAALHFSLLDALHKLLNLQVVVRNIMQIGILAQESFRKVVLSFTCRR